MTDRAPEGGSGGADVRHVTLVPRWALRWLLMCGLVIGVGYALLLTHPQPLFAYELQHAGIVVHATQPIPDEMRATLDRARARLNTSTIADPAPVRHVFMCQARWLFALFARNHYKAGGIANVSPASTSVLKSGRSPTSTTTALSFPAAFALIRPSPENSHPT